MRLSTLETFIGCPAETVEEYGSFGYLMEDNQSAHLQLNERVLRRMMRNFVSTACRHQKASYSGAPGIYLPTVMKFLILIWNFLAMILISLITWRRIMIMKAMRKMRTNQ